MGSSDDGRQTFIVRIWREPREIEGMAPEWRGLIERLDTRERRYFRRLDDLVGFIEGQMTSNDADGTA